MKQFEIEGKIFNLKNSWEDLLFSDWMNFLKIEQQKELLGQEEDYVIKVLTILTDCTELDILNAPLSLLNELMASLDYMNTPVPKIENKFIMINDEKWAFKKDFNKLTMGEYISIKTFQENSNGGEILNELIDLQGKINQKKGVVDQKLNKIKSKLNIFME